jgi:hypothetical protein
MGVMPYERLILPRKVMTTIDSLVLFDEINYKSEFWGSYIRIEKSGNIEFTDTLYSFLDYDGLRCFSYVQIVGFIWQFMFFAKNLLQKFGYISGVRIWLNLVGTRESILVDFSEGSGQNDQHWITPLSQRAFYDHEYLLNLKCPDPNLQLDYQYVVKTLDETNSFEIIKNVAINLGLAYNHQTSPRCFNYNTEIFPWDQYFSRRRS